MRFLLVLLLSAGCAGPTLVGRARDQNPLEKPDHMSEGIAIPVKDVQVMASYHEAVDRRGAGVYNPTFFQSAMFEAGGPDRLTFVVELANRWPELTHAESYDVTLTDDRGHTWRPREVVSTPARVIQRSMMVARTDVAFRAHTLGGQNYELQRAENSTDTTNMHAARSRLEFEGPGLLTRDVHRLTLHLKNKNRALEFVWEFGG